MRIYNPPHPGLVLASCFNEKFTAAQAAAKMGLAAEVLQEIIAGRRPITPEIAALLPRALPHAQPATWLGLQADYDAWQAEHPQARSSRS